jgi:hypothetical protein
MKEDKKKFSELAVNLKNKNSATVVETISDLRRQQPFTGVVSLLVDLYNTTHHENVKGTIQSFMNDIKEKDARAEVVNELKKKHKAETLEMIASSCWQSGLDYSGYAVVFAGLFAEGEYQIALECYTVLEESMNRLSRDTRDEVIEIVRDSRNNYSKEKSALMLDLLGMLA